MAERAERRLTTILAADIAEYSRLMRADEDATMRALGACRAVIDGLVAEHRGRIANTAGDAVLAEFPSVADGLACALAIQQAMPAENAEAPPDRRMRFRIGLHLGDVMTRDGDLFGDAVNIAARLEALAEPGGICVSAAVREHVGSGSPPRSPISARSRSRTSPTRSMSSASDRGRLARMRPGRPRSRRKPQAHCHCPTSRRSRYCRFRI